MTKKEITHIGNNNRCDTCYNEGFQKGKLEAIKDELNFLREIEKGTSCIDTKMFLKLRIEQLQKEIGEEKGK